MKKIFFALMIAASAASLTSCGVAQTMETQNKTANSIIKNTDQAVDNYNKTVTDNAENADKVQEDMGTE